MEVLRQLVPLLTGLLTLVVMWMAGNGDRRAWIVGLCNQGLWLIFAVSFGAWGLLPLVAAMTVVHARNLRKAYS